jgi:hypothetical protein
MIPKGRYPYALTLAALLFASGNAAPLWAGDLEIGGSTALEVRAFPNAASFDGQDRSVHSPSIVLEPEITYEITGDDVLTFVPYARFDVHDERRSHVDIRELTWEHLDSSWDATIGIGKVFWGVTESRHLVDIINQTDAVDNVDGEDKLGQPMINANILSDWGEFGLFVLPGFRERTFADDEARLRGPKPIQADDATYDSSAGDKHIDVALRWSHSIGDIDIGLNQFHGTSREPVMKTVTRSDGVSVFQPHYDIIDQSGLDAQLTSGPWLWKLETIARAGHGDRFVAAVVGTEYTLYQIAESQADLGLLAEVLYDGRDSTAPAVLTDNDAFVGARLTFNDEQDTSVLAGALVDNETQETFLSFEAERRLTDHWKAEIEARWTVKVPEDGFFAGAENDDFLMVRLARFF